jgi:hypothetical protein
MAVETPPPFLANGTLEIEVKYSHQATADEFASLLQGIQAYTDALAEAHGEASPTVWVTQVTHPNSLIVVASVFLIANKAAFIAGASSVAAFALAALGLSKGNTERKKAQIDLEKAKVDLEKSKVDLQKSQVDLEKSQADTEKARLDQQRSVAEQLQREETLRLAFRAAAAEMKLVPSDVSPQQRQSLFEELVRSKMPPELRDAMARAAETMGMTLSVRERAAPVARGIVTASSRRGRSHPESGGKTV